VSRVNIIELSLIYYFICFLLEDCLKAFSTPHSLKSHVKTHLKTINKKEKKLQNSRVPTKKPITDNGITNFADGATVAFDNGEINYTITADFNNYSGQTFDNNSYSTINAINIDDDTEQLPQIDFSSIDAGMQMQAIELNIADSDMELPPTQWIDISSLATKSIVPLAPLSTACLAIPNPQSVTYVHVPYNINQANTSYFDEKNIVLTETNTFSNNINVDYYQDDNHITYPTTIDINNDDISAAIDTIQNQEHQQQTASSETEIILNDFLMNSFSNITENVENNVNEFTSYTGFESREEELNGLMNVPVAKDLPSNKTLKEITADAGICRCTNCRCAAKGGCIGDCGPDRRCSSEASSNYGNAAEGALSSITQKFQESFIDKNNNQSTTVNNRSSCCGQTDDQQSLMDSIDLINDIKQKNCSCKDASEGVKNGCCVVICLKTLETLKNVINQQKVSKNMFTCSSSFASTSATKNNFTSQLKNF
jgi:metal regulatory transcription factor 1